MSEGPEVIPEEQTYRIACAVLEDRLGMSLARASRALKREMNIPNGRKLSDEAFEEVLADSLAKILDWGDEGEDDA